MPHHLPTVAAIRETIRARGPLTFADYMQIALHHPRHGYYLRAKIGKSGDFMTSVSTGPVWGKIWARHFRKLLTETPNSGAENFQSLEKPDAQISKDWRSEIGYRQSAIGNVYEFGGNTGQFRDDVLAECPELNYQLIESSDPMPEKMEGIVFSNELIDALPFHRLRARDGKLRELFIDLDANDELREIEVEPSLAIGHWLSAMPDGWEFEACPLAESWIRDIASRLARGFVITVDYGYTHAEYFSKSRPNGTWRTYFQHSRTDDPFANIGAQDITADVDFTSFIAAGEAAGLETVMFKDQTHALLEIGREVIEEITTRDAGELSKDRNAIHQLLHPAMMGQRFRVLIQRKR